MRADRLLSLVLLLQTRGAVTAQELAGELEVSERTIYRDVEALSLAGIPVYAQPGVSGGIFLDEDYRLALTGLTHTEIQALFVSSGPGGPLHDLGLDQAASDTLIKLLAALPAKQRDEAERMRQRVYIDPTGWFRLSEPTPFLSVLQRAVWEDVQVLGIYLHPDGRSSERRLHPYSLVAKSNVWYLVARQSDGEMRTFRVSRFQNVLLTNQPFQRPPGFDLPVYWEEASRSFEQQVTEGSQPCPAVVRLIPEEVRYFVSDLAGRYERLDVPDAQGWVHLRITFPSWGSARRHILSAGDRIQALEPADLCQWIAETARAVSAMYADPHAKTPSR